MSVFRGFPLLPRHRAMSLSPWLIVGSALILGLAIVFWAVKNTTQQRETMTRALQERAGALMWAMEGGARAGMGMQRTAFYLQYMLEETARQQGIVYMAVISPDGTIVAHSDRNRVNEKLFPPEEMGSLTLDGQIAWRVLETAEKGRIFEARRLFVPLPGLERHNGHGHMRHGAMMSRRGHRQSRPGPDSQSPPPPLPPAMDRQPGIFGSPPTLRQPGFREGRAGREWRDGRGQASALNRGQALAIVVGLDMEVFDKALESAETNTLFWALLVGLLGIGGFISLFWAQNYRLSRRMLMDATAFSSEVISSLPLGLVIFDSDGLVSHVNGVAEKLLGRPFAELRGLDPGRVYGPDWAKMAGRVKEGAPVLEEEHTLTPHGKEDAASVPVSISASRIANERGQDMGMIFLLRDLREVKGLQAELRRSERLSTLGNMAARVAHEIRNPLSSIKGFATYLATRHEHDGDREAARTMIGEVERLDRVVSELLDFARPSEMQLAACKVNELLERALRLARADAEAGGVSLALEDGGQADAPAVMADGERITQALLNLLLNAIQATGAGGSVRLTAGPVQDGRLAITVKDTGRGITPDIREKMFSPYFTTRASGTGLGLSIVARIVEEHHGEIAVRSEPERGAAITIW
ncbi:PAS domain-containing protein, partial [Desulfovibrio sp. OttesenSCG-928-G11]|nr:PAS domain-containing protein [Desulfovibrio sp. OttesenSCG-928-G11]